MADLAGPGGVDLGLGDATAPAPDTGQSQAPEATPRQAEAPISKVPTDPVELMRYDPFAKPKESDALRGAQAGAGRDARRDAPPSAGQTQPKQPTPEEVAAAQVQAQHVRAILQAQGLERTQQQQQQQPQQPADPIPQYNWQVPEPLIQAIASGDPAQVAQGVNVIVNGLAREMHRVAMGEVARLHQHWQEAIPKMMENQRATSAVHQRFYYDVAKDLNNQQFFPTVAKVAQAVERYHQNLGQQVDPYSREFMSTVATISRQILGLPPVQAGPVAPPSAAARPAAPYVSTPGVRPNGAGAPPQESFMEMIGF